MVACVDQKSLLLQKMITRFDRFCYKPLFWPHVSPLAGHDVRHTRSLHCMHNLNKNRRNGSPFPSLSFHIFLSSDMCHSRALALRTGMSVEAGGKELGVGVQFGNFHILII